MIRRLTSKHLAQISAFSSTEGELVDFGFHIDIIIIYKISMFHVVEVNVIESNGVYNSHHFSRLSFAIEMWLRVSEKFVKNLSWSVCC